MISSGSICKYMFMEKNNMNVWVEKMKRLPWSIWRTTCKVGKDDPRRIVHAFKVGLALALVSLLYLLEPFFEGIGQYAMWAVMTVVVVLEFTAGATLCKGLNRGLGTILAGSLAFIIECIAETTGNVFRAVFIGAAVFIIGAAATYVRFIPKAKNYDYGVVIFILTFNLITVSSYRDPNVFKLAQDRFYTIAIGCAICLFMSLLVFPIWSGEDLHNSTVSKLQGLANSIEACVNQYFEDSDKEAKARDDESSDEMIYEGYKAVLDSKSQDETLALHASWEPKHSWNCRYPWQQYVKLGAALRRFGYTVVALHGCLHTEIETPKCCRALFKDPCNRLASEVSKVLMELASSIKYRRHRSPEILSDHLHQALHDLNIALKSQPRLFLGSNSNHATNMLALAVTQAKDHKTEASLSSVKTDTSALLEWNSKKAMSREHSREGENKVLRPQLSKIAATSLEFSEALPFAAFASLLVETVARLDNVIGEVEELAKIAGFKEYDHLDEVILQCETPKPNVAHTNLPPDAAD